MVIMLLPLKPAQHLKKTCLTSLSRNFFPRIPSLVESHPSWQNRNSNKHLCLLAWKSENWPFLNVFFHLLQNKSTSFLRLLLFLIIRNRRILSISMFLLWLPWIRWKHNGKKKNNRINTKQHIQQKVNNIPTNMQATSNTNNLTNKPTAMVGFTTSWGLDA